MNASTASLGLLCHAGHCDGSWATPLGKTARCFSLVEACLASSGIMKAGSQGRGFQV